MSKKKKMWIIIIVLLIIVIGLIRYYVSFDSILSLPGKFFRDIKRLF